MGAFGSEATDSDLNPRSESSSVGWATSLTFATRASVPNGNAPNERHLPIDCCTDAAKAERELDAKRKVKAHRDLDRHRIETGDEG